MNETFYTKRHPIWNITEEGIVYDGILYSWNEMSNLKKEHDSKGFFGVGKFSIQFRDDYKNLYYDKRDEEKADKAFEYMKTHIAYFEFDENPQEEENAIKSMFSEIKIIDNDYYNELTEIAKSYISSEEKIHVALKGFNEEYLFCSDSNVFIIKRKISGSSPIKYRVLTKPYDDITEVKIRTGLYDATFTVYIWWGLIVEDDLPKGTKKMDIRDFLNTIYLDVKAKDSFEKAKQYIEERIPKRTKEEENKLKMQHLGTSFEGLSNKAEKKTNSNKNLAEEIKELKALLDEGVINEEEFEKGKQKILN